MKKHHFDYLKDQVLIQKSRYKTRSNKNRFCLLLLMALICHTLNIQAQNSMLKNVVPPSPNVASLGKYGDLPVSLYTGIPGISIPLYEIKSGDLTLPVSVSYHAGGVKVEEVASSVGLGWSLNAGGVIGRNVRGMQDENNYWYPIAPANSVQGIMNSNNATLQAQLADDVESGYKDGEPDLYYYNFGGHSGKFIFDQSGVAYSYPKKDLLITPYSTGFKVVSEDGTVYTFLNYEVNNPSNCGNDQFVTTAWYLTNIKSSDGKREIIFTYEQSVYTYTTLLGEVKYFSVNGSGNQTCMTNQNCLGTQHYVTHRLKKIDFGEGYLNFTYNNVRCDLVDDKSLDEVAIYTQNNSLLKKYKFFYSYFGNNSDGVNRFTEHTKRLKLDSLREETATSTKPPHSFTYNTAIALPDRLSYAQDFWGYNNGKTNNPGLVSKFWLEQNGAMVFYPGADRKTDTNFAQAGILTKMKYPTGGETLFTYESNVVSDNYSEYEVRTEYTSINWSGDANSMPNPYNSFASLVIPAGGAQVEYHASGLDGLAPGCDVGQLQIIKDGSIYSTMGNNWNGIISTLPQGTYSLRYIYECGVGSTVSFSASITASIPITTNFPSRPVGGLRIKKMEDRAGSGEPVIKNYRYHAATNPNVSSGVLVSFPEFGYDLIVNSWYHTSNGTNNGSNYCVYKVRQSFSTYPMATTQGAYVGYANVIEDLGVNGETWHTFNAYGDGVSGFPFPPVENYEWRRGFNTGSKYYARKNNQLVLVKEISNIPVSFGSFRVYGIKTGRNFMEIVDGMLVGAPYFHPVFTWYFNEAEFFDIAQTVEKTFDQNDPTRFIEKRSDYTYSTNHLQRIRTQTVVSSSDATIKEEEITNRKFPFDYTFGGTPVGAEATGIKKLQDLHVVDEIIEENTVRQQRNTSNNSLINQRVVSGSISTFRTDNPYPEQLMKLEMTSPVPLATYGTGSGISGNAFIRNVNSTVANAFKPAVLFSNYDDKGNLTTQRKADDLSYSYLWGYDKRYPVAQAMNAYVSDVFYSSFEEGDGNSTDGDSKTGRKSKTNGFTIALSSLKNGQYRLTYWLKSGGSWSLQNITPTVTTGQYTINLSGQIDEVRFYPVSAQMITMTYDPLIGMTSQTDVNNRITYFEYDEFQRLTLVRDQDKNIVKRICYNYYTGQQENCSPNTSPLWQATGVTRCKPCPANSIYITNILQSEERDNNNQSATYNQTRWTDVGASGSCVSAADWQNTVTAIRCKTIGGVNTGEREQEQKDMNPCSATYNQLRWTVVDQNCTVCAKPAVWQSTGNYRCVKDGSNNNTGMQEREEINIETCSATYNQLRWVSNGFNAGACPLPYVCNSSNCSGPMYKCVNGVCEQGQRANKSSVKVKINGVFMWRCTYFYCFSDGSISSDQIETNASPCLVGGTCLL